MTSKARLIWGPSPLPEGATVAGVIRHPRDGMLGVRITLASGAVVHGAAGVIRSLPDAEMRRVMSRLGSARSERKAAASRENGKRGGRPRTRHE